ncbi:MAG: hypothetical protein L6408_06155 [Nanoarchaeota archaeon]|nr:hypothetical protein [Nanoarchaeota archaeon]
MIEECMLWLDEIRQPFPKLDKKVILAEYKKMSKKSLGFVKAKIEQKIDFDPEALLLGKNPKIKKKRTKPSEFKIFINQELQKIKNEALRKQVVQSIMVHELLHIENEDLVTLSKDYRRRKKKKIHTKYFEEEYFKRFNQLRKMKGIMEIEKKEHLNIAINKILQSIDFGK